MPTSIRDPIYRDLIAGLTEARIAADLTQQAVADRLGKPQSYIAKIEGCERRVDIVEFLQIAAAIGRDPMPIVRCAWKAVNAQSGRS